MIQDGLYNPFIINNIQVKTYYYEHFLNFYPRAEESSHLTIQCDQFAGQSWFNGSFYPVFPESVVFIHKERQKMVKWIKIVKAYILKLNLIKIMGISVLK